MAYFIRVWVSIQGLTGRPKQDIKSGKAETAALAMKGRVSPLRPAREGNPLAERFPRDREEKTTPELAPKPHVRIRGWGAPLKARTSAVACATEREWNRESPRLLTGGLFAFSGGMDDGRNPGTLRGAFAPDGLDPENHAW